jgi:hypothetical protein
MQSTNISTVAASIANPPPSTKAKAPTTTAATAATTPTKAAAAAPTQSVASTVSTATATLPTTTYSTRAGGKNYSANISESNGTYTLSVPNVPGGTVTGTSLTAAEAALSTRIDILA